MKIREFDQEQLETLIEIFIQVYNNTPWNDNWDREKANTYLREFIANPLFIGYLAYQDIKLIGGCFGVKQSWWKGNEYFIHEIFIHDSFQGQGMGSRFLKKIEQELEQKDIKSITISTNKDIPADKFYESNGFKTKEEKIFKFKNL